MKLSFSTRGWPGLSWEEMLETATDMGFSGVEVYNLPVYRSDVATGPSYLLCPECAKKFKKAMEDFINVEGSAV